MDIHLGGVGNDFREWENIFGDLKLIFGELGTHFFGNWELILGRLGAHLGGRELIWGDWELIWRNGTHYRRVGSDLGEWKLILGK